MRTVRLFVGNLLYYTTKEQLFELFKEYGTVNNISIIKEQCYAFVEIETNEDPELFAGQLDGIAFDGTPLQIELARPPRTKDRRDAVSRLFYAQ